MSNYECHNHSHNTDDGGKAVGEELSCVQMNMYTDERTKQQEERLR